MYSYHQLRYILLMKKVIIKSPWLILLWINLFGGKHMRIGVPKEIKNNENRVAMTPAGVVNLLKFGHEVFIEKGAGTWVWFFR